MPDVSVTRRIEAPPDSIWRIVSDPTRMGEWSPENTGAKWLDGATGPAVGARFRGSNKHSWLRWRTTCTVTDYEPARTFAFEVTSGPVPIAQWSYRLAPNGNATEVTEEWTNRTWPPMSRLMNRVIGVKSRKEFSRYSIETTLAAIADHLERQSATTPEHQPTKEGA